MVVPAGSTKSFPPPPPLAALRTRKLPAEPAVEAQPLALVPQWEDALDPMRPAPKRGRGAAFWWKIGGASLAAGALVAAGYLGALLSGKYEPQLQAAQSVRAIAKLEAPVLTSTSSEARTRRETLQPTAAESEPPANAVAELGLGPAFAAPHKSAQQSKQPARSAKLARAKRAPKLALHEPPVPEEQSGEDVESDETAVQPVAAPVVKLERSTKPAPALPGQPSREEVQAGIEQIRPALSACAAGAHGTVFANLTIVASGRVSYSVVEGEFTSGSVGSCMARALRSASFPQFAGPAFKVRYPFVF
jgi:hypothetical protein